MEVEPDSGGRPQPHSGLIALAASAVAIISILTLTRGRLPSNLGDTDDALRLVMVRDLVSGASSWFNPHIVRLQPPLGADMHWSRLVDAGLAGVDRVFQLFLAPDRAEYALRSVWPLAWLVLAVTAAIFIVRRVAGRSGVEIAALLVVSNMLLFIQFWPGRIDHHNVQITLTLAAVLGAMGRGARSGLFAGAATALCIAVGLESLPFLAIAGAAFGVRFLFRPESEARTAQAYAASLLVVTSLSYLIQTPPQRWGLAVCDALAINLWAGISVAACGLFAAAAWTARQSFFARLAVLALVGAAAGGAYLAIHPACIGGPLAEVNPAIRPIWLNFIQEMQPPLPKFWKHRSIFIAGSLLLNVIGLLSMVWLGLRRESRTPAWLLLSVCYLTAVGMALDTERSIHYASWFAVPLIAAALTDLSARYWRGSLIGPILLAACFSQYMLMAVLPKIPAWRTKNTVAVADRCYARPQMRRLAAQPTGLVLAEIDLGPRILAQTRHSAVAAPYHRLAPGILAAYGALSAPPGKDEAAVRKLGATLVVTCPGRSDRLTHTELGRASLQQRLDRGEIPGWLQPLSPHSEAMQVYRVRSLSIDSAPRG